jgi:hypothetical protein
MAEVGDGRAPLPASRRGGGGNSGGWKWASPEVRSQSAPAALLSPGSLADQKAAARDFRLSKNRRIAPPSSFPCSCLGMLLGGMLRGGDVRDKRLAGERASSIPGRGCLLVRFRSRSQPSSERLSTTCMQSMSQLRSQYHAFFQTSFVPKAAYLSAILA